MYDTEEGSISLSGTFFCERTTAQSLPRTPIDMMFAAVIALKAYSTWYNLPWSEKIVMCLSYAEAPDILSDPQVFVAAVLPGIKNQQYLENLSLPMILLDQLG
jgi:hypothetical protein